LFSLSMYNPSYCHSFDDDSCFPLESQALSFYEEWFGKWLEESPDDFIM